MAINKIKKELKFYSSSSSVKDLQRFFKTGPGDYGEGDLFLGVKVPNIRKVAKKYIDLNLKDVEELLHSKMHEERLTALLILTYAFPKSDLKKKERIFKLYLKNTKYINNWDLVDLSAHKIVGEYLVDKKRNVLYGLAKSKSLWERRISIISTFQFIRNNDFKDSLKIAKILLQDEHDLIHKAVGWMLREIGKRDFDIENEFLKKHYNKMPRTMLRYSIERFPEPLRQKYLKDLI